MKHTGELRNRPTEYNQLTGLVTNGEKHSKQMLQALSTAKEGKSLDTNHKLLTKAFSQDHRFICKTWIYKANF